jgi:cytochrome oxidase Cu insertion factor (SCO1/SenC/PrrC family)
MTRKWALIVVLVVLIAGAGLAAWRGVWPFSAPGGHRASRTGDAVTDLMMDLQILPVDQPAKPFTLQTLDGRSLSLGELAGRPVLLYFWATW